MIQIMNEMTLFLWAAAKLLGAGTLVIFIILFAYGMVQGKKKKNG